MGMFKNVFICKSSTPTVQNQANHVFLDREKVPEISRTRIRGAKERAIAPGPRLDRHPDEEEVLAYRSELANLPNGQARDHQLDGKSTRFSSEAKLFFFFCGEKEGKNMKNNNKCVFETCQF